METFVKIPTDEINLPDCPAVNFKFELDKFQKQAVESISQHKNVLVTAHTSSGKTAVAEYAIAQTLREGKKAIYTSPIKSLSNQKYQEFKIKFHDLLEELGYGEEGIGILTGDVKINPDAQCIIMTTEILRNALYRIGETDSTRKESELKLDFLDEIGCVVFDEVHYLKDDQRGHVWEESLNLLDPSILLVLLSATVPNAKQFANWIGRIKKKDITLITTSHRVIPLKHNIFFDDTLYPLMDKNGKIMNESINVARKDFMDVKKSRRPIHMLNTCIPYLMENDHLPAIFFSFSRKNCEKFAKTISVSLLSPEECATVKKEFFKLVKNNLDVCMASSYYTYLKDLIEKGIAVHHAGLHLILKEVVEKLFQMGLIKVLFVTETFAVGVNMPTKTVVFTELSKYTGKKGTRYLNTDEYIQMSGRAGRRGLDKIGTVIYLPLYDFPDNRTFVSILTGRSIPLTSRFFIDYSFILKILMARDENLTGFLSNSLYKEESMLQMQHTKIDYNKKLAKYELLGHEFDSDDEVMVNIKKYWDMEHKMEKSIGGFKIKISNKQRKERKRFMILIRDIYKFDEKYAEFSDYKKLEKEVIDLKSYIDYYESEIPPIVNDIGVFLYDLGYLSRITKFTDLNQKDVSPKGIIASQINECNPLILTEALMTDTFKGLGPEELVALMALFIDDHRSGVDKNRTSVNVSHDLKMKFHKIENIIEKFITKEKELGINFYLEGYWNINYNFVEIALAWVNGTSKEEIFESEEIFEGNFIKNLLKINNMCHDIACLCKIIGKIDLLPTLEKIEPLIIRDIVSSASLYLI
jgi:superfamily II RNA helicase